MRTTVTQRGFTWVVERGERRATVSVKNVLVEVSRPRSLHGVGHQRGFVAQVSVDGQTHGCGHRLHTDRGSAMACGTRLAKRLVRDASA